MVTLAQLRDTNLAGLGPAATAYDTLAVNFGKHVQTMQHEVTKHVFNANWVGNAAGAANASLQRTSTRLDAAHTEMSAVSGLLREALDSLLLAQAKLKEALQDAKNLGLTVSDDGAVSWPAPSKTEQNDPGYNIPERAKALAARMSAAVAEADNADQKIAALLDALTARARNGTGLEIEKAAADLKAVTQQGVDLMTAGFPPAGTPATDVNSWWNSLPPDEQQHLIQAYPDLLGMRDGIPAVARDQANRIQLSHLIDAYEHKPGLTDDEKQKLDGFRAIRDKLKVHGEQPPPMFLIGVSEEGQGRGILSYGNPDTAKNVSAYVPGLGTTLADVANKDGDRAYNVWKATQNADPTASAASMVWLGYDPPPGLGNLSEGDTRPLEVTDTDRAAKGGAAYDKFMSGLRATHEGQAAHLVALAHSYGSTTAGMGAQMPGGTGADDIILIGSPGTGAQNASQLNIDPGHVWVGAADSDPVSHLPSPARVAFGSLYPAMGPYADDLYTAAGGPPNQLWFGQDPAGKEFGANRFAVPIGLPQDSHSTYMEKPNPNAGPFDNAVSSNNIGQIVAGRYANVTRQDPR
ncbi:alpha/beta hydrolase [Kitasatospora sp. NPDC092039]|uniref:alpha/beta hydrolase n=1 Tax=Kitasatospora sp. NPDC092039 TaxID=3364086 RepID=UPI003808D9EA